MKIYWCDPQKGRKFCSKPERFCGRYCTMTFNSRYAADPKPLSLEVIEAENERIRELYEKERKEQRNDR